MGEPHPSPAEPWEEFADALLRRAVAHFLADRDQPPDALAGVRVDDAEASRLVSSRLGSLDPEVRAALDADVATGRARLRAALAEPNLLSAVAHIGRLSDDEAEVLAFLLAIELAPTRQRLLMYAQDNVTLNRPTLATLRRLLPDPHAGALAVSADSRLVRAALVEVEGDGPWGGRTVGVALAVAWAFIGDTSLDPDLPVGIRLVSGAGRPTPEAEMVVLVSGADSETRLGRAQAMLQDRPLLVTPCPSDRRAWEAIVREATMGGLAIVLDVAEHLAPEARRWIERADHLAWVVSAPADLPMSELPSRPWIEESLVDEPVSAAEIEAVLGDGLGAGHRLNREQLRLAAVARQARGASAADAVRRLASGHLDRMATRIRPRRTWEDVVLPADQLDHVHTIVDRYRNRQTVYGEWGFRPLPSAGLVALFSGPSGTGKTLTAEVVAGELGLDLYKLDLSAVVSKYIGETEQNLESVFKGAEAADVVLFFDEADSLLGKRSEVSDAHDRYANIEVAYLLQRLERYDGLVILATNLAKNIDQAFVRRIHVSVEFPTPEEPERLAIWERSFPSTCPTGGLDLGWLAKKFDLTGGSIRNVALAAAFRAASAGEDVTMSDVTAAVRRELQKLGRLIHEGDLVPPNQDHLTVRHESP